MHTHHVLSRSASRQLSAPRPGPGRAWWDDRTGPAHTTPAPDLPLTEAAQDLVRSVEALKHDIDAALEPPPPRVRHARRGVARGPAAQWHRWRRYVSAAALVVVMLCAAAFAPR